MWSVVNYIDESNSLNNYAVSSDGIATALKDSASALMEGGNNLEQATALVAAANRVVQDPNSVGSALRTISLRLRGTSVEILEEMGEETDGVVESTSKLQEKLKALTGVDILTDAGAYKDTYTILKEIGEVWQNLDTMDQAAALELIAGKNRANTLAAILNNMKDLEGAYESAMDAEGSAMRENEAYLDSIQGRVDLFTNALQTLWMNLLKSDMIKGIVDAGTLLIQLLDTGHGKIMAIIGALMVYAKIHNKTKFSDMFKGTVEVLTKVVSGTKEVTVATVAEALAAKKVSAERVRELLVKSGLAGIDGQLTNGKIKVAAATLTEALRAKELTAAQYLAAMSSMGLKTALKGLWNVLKANPIMLAATAVTVLALAFDQFHTTAQEAADTAREAFDEIQNVVEATKSTIQSLESELSTIQDKIDELDGKKLSFAEDQELKKLKKQRAELEHSLKVQQQLLELQRNSSSKQAIASMKAYTKATSEGAKETQDTAKTWGTIGGIVLGIAGALLAIPSGGTSLGMTVAAVGAGGVAGGFAGNKVGEAIGSGIAANEGTYDSWYETYTKALDAARKDEQKALENYQKDSSNIDKLDKWQDAQQRTSEIESEMYEHLSQMQQYYNDLEYGTSNEIDKELDAWYNFMDKLSISEGASGAEVTALDRIFGENASEEIQLIKEQILDSVAAGDDFDFDSAINGSQALKNTLQYVGLTAEDVKNYFTQIGEASKIATNNITPVKTYSVLLEDAENYNEILSQTSEIVSNNTKVTQEYKDSLLELGISSDELNECFDENNKLVVKDAKALNELVKSAKKNTAQNIRLAKSQAKLEYYELYKEIKRLTNGQRVNDQATLDQINSLYAQMTAVQKTIAKYSLLEATLLGSANAYTKLAEAQEMDEISDYGTKAEELVNVLAEAFNTSKLGTEAAQVAIAGLIPDEVFAEADTLDDKMQKIYEYFTGGKVSKLFTIEFDDDGGISSVEMTKENVEKFTQSLIDADKVFHGTWDEFTLDDSIKTLDQFAYALGVTKEVALAYLTELEKYDISWLGGDGSTLIDQLMPTSEEIDEFGRKMNEAFSQGSIDLTLRPRVDAKTMQEAGWDVPDGSYSTVDTVTYKASDFGLAEKDSKDDYGINVTPILPDGTVIKGGHDGLYDYIMGNLDSGKSINDLPIFLGAYKTVEEASRMGEELHEAQEVYFAMLDSYSLDNEIYRTTRELAELEYQLATGAITAEEYSKAMYGENGLAAKEAELGQRAREDTNAYYQKTEQLKEYQNQLSSLQKQLQTGVDDEGNVIDKEQVQKDVDAINEKITGLVKSINAVGTPTQITLELAKDSIEAEIKELEQQDITISGKVKFDDNIGQWVVSEGEEGNDAAKRYAELKNESDTISDLLGGSMPTVETYLSNIESILTSINTTLAGGDTDKSGDGDENNESDDTTSTENQNAQDKDFDEALKIAQEMANGTYAPGASEAGGGAAGTYGPAYTDPAYLPAPTPGPQPTEQKPEPTPGPNDNKKVFAEEVVVTGSKVVEEEKSATTPFDVAAQIASGIYVGPAYMPPETRSGPNATENNIDADVISGASEYAKSANDLLQEYINIIKALQSLESGEFGFDSVVDQKVGEAFGIELAENDNISVLIEQLIEKKKQLEEPIMMELDATSQQTQQEIDNFKQMLEDAVNSDGNNKQALYVNALVKDIDTSGLDNLEQLGFQRGSNGTWEATANVKGWSFLDEQSKQMVLDYIQLIEDEHVLDLITGQGTETTEDDLYGINSLLGQIAQKFKPTYTLTADTNGEEKITALKSKWDGVENKTVTIWASVKKAASNLWDLITGGGSVNGTAHVNGTAYKGGSWGAPKTETSLVGELGPEMRVRGNRWELIGQNGAEFTDVRKGDIIFNHKQTEDLLSKGYVTGRGKAYALGTSGAAYAGIDTFDDHHNKLSSDYSNTKSGDSDKKLSKAASDLSDAADEFKEVFDWIEVRIEEINEDISLKSAKLENSVGSTKQNAVIDDMIELNQKLYDNLTAGAAKYNAFAAKLLAKVPAEYRKAAQDGSIAIESFTGEVGEKTLNAIQDYREWVQKGADATQQAEETLTEISNLAKQAIDNIASDYENKASIPGIKLEQLEAYNALLETDVGYESTKLYNEMIKANNQTISLLKQQRDQMQAEFNAQVDAGNIKKYSQAWYDAVNDIAAVDTEIIGLTTDTENYQDSINELHFEKFDNLMSRIEAISDEAENLIDILSNKDLINKDTAEWTDEGITTLGLYAQQMEVAEIQAKKYKEEINYLNKNWKQLGYTEQEYIEKLEELKNGQYDAIKAYNDTKKAIKDLTAERVDAIKDGIEKEMEAYEELINKKKEELDAEKDLYDFQKGVANQQKEIATIERKLAALSSDNSASARAKRAQLEAELLEARQELADTYYDRSVSNQQEALDKELEAFREEKDKEMEGWDEYLENTEKVVADGLAIIQSNTETIYNTLQEMGEEYSLSISDALTSPWEHGEYAIQSYSEKFKMSMSKTVEELKKVAEEHKKLVDEIEAHGSKYVENVNDNITRYQGAEKATKQPSGNGGLSTAGAVSSLSGNIQYGQSGANVKKLQQALNALGFNCGSVDGIFGDKTLEALKKFQSSSKYGGAISADGIVGPNTKNKFKVAGYAGGTTGVKSNQWAVIDELGEELVIRPSKGRMTFLEKGSSVVPADLAANLMEWGELDPSIMLERNKPVISAPHITNNNVEINMEFGEVVHIDTVTNDTIPNLTKAIEKQMDKYMKNVNNNIRKYTR